MQIGEQIGAPGGTIASASPVPATGSLSETFAGWLRPITGPDRCLRVRPRRHREPDEAGDEPVSPDLIAFEVLGVVACVGIVSGATTDEPL